MDDAISMAASSGVPGGEFGLVVEGCLRSSCEKLSNSNVDHLRRQRQWWRRQRGGSSSVPCCGPLYAWEEHHCCFLGALEQGHAGAHRQKARHLIMMMVMVMKKA